MQRVNVLLPVGLWPALAKAAVNRGHQRASFVRMVLLNACEKGAVVSQLSAPVPASSGLPSPKKDELYEEPVPPFDPSEKFVAMLIDGEPIPYALQKVRELCARHGHTDWAPPKTLNAGFVASYREEALVAGRDPDAELRLLAGEELA